VNCSSQWWPSGVCCGASYNLLSLSIHDKLAICWHRSPSVCIHSVNCAQVNDVLVNGKSVEEIQQMLDDCGNQVLLELVRCRRMTPTSCDLSQCSPFQTPTSPLTADEFDPPSVTDMRNRGDSQTALLCTNAPEVIRKSDKFSAKPLNTSQPDMAAGGDSCSNLGRVKENKTNFLDKAVSAIRRPFRSRLSRATRDERTKSAAFVYVGNSNTAVDDLAVVGIGENISTAVGSPQPNSSAYKENSQSLSRVKASDSGHGTWPKYRAHAVHRPSALPLYATKPLSTNIHNESPLLPNPVHHGINVQRNESARHHRPQISDSVVDYVRHDNPCSGSPCSGPPCSGPQSSTDAADSSSALYTNVSPADSMTPLGPHCAKRFPDETNETTVTVRSRGPAEHHVTISHFPAQHCDTEMVSYGGHTKYMQRPIPYISSFSSVGSNLTDSQLLNTSGVIMSSPHCRPQEPSLARYDTIIVSYF